VHLIVAGEMQEFQVVEPVVLVATVFMVDFCLLLHGEEQSAVPTSSALMLEEFSSGCVQSDVRSCAGAPIAPVAIIRAYAFAQSSMSFEWGLDVPSQRTLFPDDIVLAPASWLEVLRYYTYCLSSFDPRLPSVTYCYYHRFQTVSCIDRPI
jgi:hypothetical protein